MTGNMKLLILAVGVLCFFKWTEGLPSPAKAEQDGEEVDLADRIVGGTQADRNKHPYIVSLKGEPVDKSLCTGSSTTAPTNSPTTTTPPTTTPGNNNGDQDCRWCSHCSYCPSCWLCKDYDYNYYNGNHWNNNNWNGGGHGSHNHHYHGHYGKRASDGHFCGASLVSATHLVTAAHCVKTGTCYKVVIDEENRGSGGGKIVRYALATQHEDYNSNTMENDIAVMKLNAVVDHVGNDRITPIPLATTTPSGNQKCTVAGWGTTQEGGSTSNSLLEVEVPIVSKGTCSQNYGSGSISNGMICAGQGGKDSCQGDSGGPLVCQENGRNVLSGVVSWGSGCARPDNPGVYTDVSKYAGWIQNHI